MQVEADFRYIDRDGDGLLYYKDLSKLCQYVGIQCEPALAYKLCRVIGREVRASERARKIVVSR